MRRNSKWTRSLLVQICVMIGLSSPAWATDPNGNVYGAPGYSSSDPGQAAIYAAIDLLISPKLGVQSVINGSCMVTGPTSPAVNLPCSNVSIALLDEHHSEIQTARIENGQFSFAAHLGHSYFLELRSTTYTFEENPSAAAIHAGDSVQLSLRLREKK